MRKKTKSVDMIEEAKKSIKRNARRKNVVGDDSPDFKRILDDFKPEDVLKRVFQRTVMDVKTTNQSGESVVAMDSMFGGTPSPQNMCGCGVKPNGPDFLSMNINPLYPNAIDEKILRHYSRHFFIGWNACSLLVQHPLMSRACSVPGEDAIAVGYTIKSREKSSKKFEQELIDISEANGLSESLRQIDAHKRIFGSALAIPCFEEDDIDMSNPLVDLDILKGKHFLGWSIVDPYWVTPILDDRSATDPTYRDYFKPTWWHKPNGKDVHKSWCIHLVNTVVPDILKPTYYYGGVPLTQMAYERLYAADKVANEAQMLAMSKRLLVMEANVQKMAARPEFALNVMENLKWNRDNWGILPVPKDTKVQQLDSYITEFNQLITTQYQLFCAIVQIPAPKLMMTPLTGFASTGNYEWKVYAQSIMQIQKNEFRPFLEKHFQILTATMGSAKKYDIEFGKIDVPTLMEEATIEYNKARAYMNVKKADESMLLAKAARDKKSLADEV